MTREEAKYTLLHIYEQCAWGSECEEYGCSVCEDALNMAIEALQAEPVKHGEWKYYNYSDLSNPYIGYYECTVCKQHEHAKHKYCPNCGAKMNKGGDTE